MRAQGIKQGDSDSNAEQAVQSRRGDAGDLDVVSGFSQTVTQRSLGSPGSQGGRREWRPAIGRAMRASDVGKHKRFKAW
jgi:hypothetical protein